MILVILTAFVAVCGAAKLDQNYLPPITAKTAGGSPGALQAPFDGFDQGVIGLPSGSYTNDAQGVVVDAVSPGTMTSGVEATGLGGPRTSYGSIDSKVGNAAFTSPDSEGSVKPLTRIAPGFESIHDGNANKHNGNNLKFATDVGSDSYNYEYETDTGISVGENGIAANGVKAQGGYSYKGNDGKTYKVTYTADKNGYKPQGQHLPTPPPIPDEILKSLEKNAKEEAAGHVDDGSYDAQKYNDEGDYSSDGADNNKGRPTIGSGDAATIGSLVSQSPQGLRPTSGVLIGSYNPGSVLSHTQGFVSEDKQSGFGVNKNKSGSQVVNAPEYGFTEGGKTGNVGLSTTQFGNNGGTNVQFGAKPQFGSQGSQVSPQKIVTEFGSRIQTPSFHRLSDTSNVNTAYSSGVVSGSGSTNAFASTGSAGSKLSTEYNPSRKTPGSADLYHTQGSISGSSQSPQSASTTASVAENQHNFGHDVNSIPSRFGESQSDSKITPTAPHKFISGQYNAQNSQATYTGSTDAIFASSTQKPAFGQQQGIDHSYYYNQPAKPFNTPTSSKYSNNYQTNFPLSSLNQQGSKYPNTGITSTTSKFVDSYNGITQATISSFPSSSPSFQNAANNQFGSKPTLSQSSTSQQSHTKFGGTGSQQTFGQTQTQFGQSSSSHTSYSTQSPTQQYQGTVYEYKKPAQTLPPADTDSQVKPSLGTSFGQAPLSAVKPFTTTQSGSSLIVNTASKSQSGQTLQVGQKPFGYTQTGSSSQQNQLSSTTQTSQGIGSTSGQGQFGEASLSGSKPFTAQQSGNYFIGNTASKGQYGQTLQFGQKPFSYTQTGTSYKQNQFGQITLGSSQTGSNSKQDQLSSTTQTSQGIGSTSGQGQIGQVSLSGSKPFTAQQSGYSFIGNTASKSQSGQTSQSGQKPFGFTQTGSSYKQNQSGQIPFGFHQTGSSPQQNQFGSTTQTSQGIGSTSDQGLVGQTSLSGFKPFTTSQTGSSFIVNTASKGQSGQTLQFGQKPFGYTQTSSSSQQHQLGSTTHTSQGIIGSTLGQSQIGQASLSGLKPFTTPQTGSSFTGNTVSKDQTGQTSQSVQKPFGFTQTGTSYKQNRFGLIPFGSSQTGFSSQQNQLGSTTQTSQGIDSNSGQGQFGQVSLSGSKPFTAQQSGYSFIDNTASKGQSGQTSQSDQKPFGYTQTESSYKQNQFGQLPFGSSQTGSNSQQNQLGSTTHTSQGIIGSTLGQSQIGQASLSGLKPFTTPQSGSSFIGNTASKGQSGQTLQFGQKPFGYTQTGSSSQQNQLASTTQTPQGIGSNGQVSLSGSKPFTAQQSGYSFIDNTASKGQSAQTSQSDQKPFGYTQTESSYKQNKFGQLPFGSSQTGSNSQQNQLGSTTHTSQGIIGSTLGQSQKGQASLSGLKPFTTPQTGSSFIGNTASKGQSGQTLQFGQKPFGYTQTGSNLQQNQLASTTQTSQGIGSTSGYSQVGQTSLFGSKPFTAQQSGYSFNGNTASNGQYVQTSQSGQKPFSYTQTGSSYKQNQFGQIPLGSSQTGSNSQQIQLGSTTQTSLGIGSTSDQGQVGQTSLSGLKPFPAAQTGSSFIVNTASKGQSGQTLQFGQKPFGYTQTGSSSQQNQLASTTQTSQGIGSTSGYSQVGQTSLFGSKPFTAQQSGYSFNGNTASNGQYVQTSQSGQKPFSYTQTGSSYKQNQFGQIPLGSTQTGSNSQQNQLGSTTQTSLGIGSTSGQGQVGQTSLSGLKPFPAAQTGSSFIVNTASKGQSGQTLQFGQKPFSYTQTGSNLQQNQLASTTQTSQGIASTSGYSQVGQTSLFGSKPFTAQQSGYSFNGNTASNGQYVQTSQSGQKPFSYTQTGSSYKQNQFGQIPFGSSQTGSNSQQNQLGSTTQTSQDISSTSGQGQVGQTSLSGFKPFSTQQSASTYQNIHSGSIGSQLGQKQISQTPSSTFGSYSQTSQFNNQAQKPQSLVNVFASSSGSNVAQYGSQTQKPSGITQTNQVFKYQQTGQSGIQQQGATGSQIQKPFSSTLTQNHRQETENTQTSSQFGTLSQFGQNSGQTSQKPFGVQSTQATLQQGQLIQGQKLFGSGQGTASQNGFQGGQNGQPAQSNTQTSIFTQSSQSSYGSVGSSGYNYQKPQTGFNTASQFGQKTQQSVTTFNPYVATSQQQSSVQPIKPIASSLTQGSFEQFQGSKGSTQFGEQSTKKTDYSSFSQPSRPQLSAGTSSSQNENSVVSTTQFGTQPALSTGVAHFSGKPFKGASTQGPSYSTQAFSGSLSGAQPTQSAIVTTQSPSQFYFSGGQYQANGYSSTLAPSFPSKLGSNVSAHPQEHIVSTVPTPIVSGHELDKSSQGSFQGQGEKFGGPRDPPKFDDKTGYHY